MTIPWANWQEDNPCSRECQNRQIGCHGTCSEYAKYKKRVEAEKQNMALERDTQYELTSFKIECIEKTRQRTHKYFRRYGQ